MFLFNYRKSVEVINYFANKENGSIDKLKCIKLVWLADRLHLINYGRTITYDSYYAMNKGPVPSGTKDLIDDSSFLSKEEKSYRNNKIVKEGNNIHSIADVDNNLFSKTEINVLDTVYKHFKGYDGKKLSEFSHKFPEWLKNKDSLSPSTSRVPIQILDFLQPLENKDKQTSLFYKDKNWLELLTEMYLENESVPFRAV
jgi:uncharacterized phage-associated protein